jgi:hypothetical protein
MKGTYSLIVIAAVLAVGCNSAPAGYKTKKTDPVKPAEKLQPGDPSFLPLREANSWTYTMRQALRRPDAETQTLESEITFRVAKVQQSGDRTSATIEVVRNGKVEDRQVWTATPKGLYQTAMGLNSVAFQPPQPMALAPLEPGARAKVTSRGMAPNGRVGTNQVELTVLATQVVDTGQGRMEAFPVNSLNRFTTPQGTGASEVTSFFHPGIGIVRYRQEVGFKQAAITSVLTIKSYSVK